MQTQTPLITQNGHLFARIDGRDWIVDTGSPASFGNQTTLSLAGQSFSVASGHMGLTAGALSDLSTAGAMESFSGAEVTVRWVETASC